MSGTFSCMNRSISAFSGFKLLLESPLDKWGLIFMTTTCLRDNAPNMIKAFCPTISFLTSAGCLNHLIQLVLNHTIFSKASVENLIKKTHSLASFANSSTKFMCELYLQQEKQYGCTSKWSIKADVVTRYDVNCNMFNFCRQ